jgi:uncharacterized membrane protein YccC
LVKPSRLNVIDVVIAVELAAVSCIAYWCMAILFPLSGDKRDVIGGLWAAISAVIVLRSSRHESLAAAIARLRPALVSFVLCLAYLAFWPPSLGATALLIAIGSLLVQTLGHREELGTAAIATSVIMYVAMIHTSDFWHEPIFRFLDTAAGVAVGLAVAVVNSWLLKPRSS